MRHNVVEELAICEANIEKRSHQRANALTRFLSALCTSSALNDSYSEVNSIPAIRVAIPI